MRLIEMINVIENNQKCVILEVKDNNRLNLIKLGCFNGNERLIRFTKGIHHTLTVFTDKSNYSWEFGLNGHTLISDKLKQQQNLIIECIKELKIDCGKYY